MARPAAGPGAASSGPVAVSNRDAGAQACSASDSSPAGGSANSSATNVRSNRECAETWGPPSAPTSLKWRKNVEAFVAETDHLSGQAGHQILDPAPGSAAIA